MAVKVKHHKGAWWVFIDHRGKRKAKRIGASKRAAEQVAEKIQAKIALGQFAVNEDTHPQPALFGDYAAEWLKTYAAVRCKASTVREYETLLSRYLLPAFAPRPLAAITREDVKRALATWLDTDLSRARIYMVMRLLGTIFTSAIEDGKVTTNPAAKPGRLLPPKPPTRDTIDALTKAELRLLLDTLREGWPMYYPFFLTLARAGLRLGEALALQWGDVDWHGGFLTIRRGLRKGVLSTTKSKQARRVDMSRQLQETLQALRETRQEHAWTQGWTEIPEWVFCQEDGSLFCDVTVRRDVLRPALHRAGVRQIRLHDLSAIPMRPS